VANPTDLRSTESLPFDVDFRIEGPSLNVQEVSVLLGRKPAHFRNPGDLGRKNGFWSIGEYTRDVEQTIVALLPFLESRSDQIGMLANDNLCYIRVGVFLDDAVLHESFTFSAQTLNRISQLNLKLEVTSYVPAAGNCQKPD
jgi:hypothetical protein